MILNVEHAYEFSEGLVTPQETDSGSKGSGVARELVQWQSPGDAEIAGPGTTL